MNLGPIILDIEGTQLNAEDKELLQHPLVGGVIFFTRNFKDKQQLIELVLEIRRIRPQLLLCVDHEGGRVQRFREGFTKLPPCRPLGELFDEDPTQALHAATEIGWLMAAELRDIGIDFSFAPVVDLDFGVSSVIGDRAFHRDTAAVATLTRAYMQGMAQAGMANVAKHFPGHGGVAADSHTHLPVDNRPLDELMGQDIKPFAELISQRCINAVMPAHVIYSDVDEQPAGFSKIWIQDILRKQLGFDGVIFSDDLDMAAAHVMGGFAERAKFALDAGCDIILVCNNRVGAKEVLASLSWQTTAEWEERINRMRGQTFQQNEARLGNAKQIVNEISTNH